MPFTPSSRGKSGKVALSGLWLGVPRGQCFGYLGANGAGKSTTIRLLTGFAWPSAGTATVLGDSIATQMKAVRGNIGYCPQFDALHDKLTVRSSLNRSQGPCGHHMHDTFNALFTRRSRLS